jgi:hypothetical protein
MSRPNACSCDWRWLLQRAGAGLGFLALADLLNRDAARNAQFAGFPRPSPEHLGVAGDVGQRAVRDLPLAGALAKARRTGSWHQK